MHKKMCSVEQKFARQKHASRKTYGVVALVQIRWDMVLQDLTQFVQKSSLVRGPLYMYNTEMGNPFSISYSRYMYY